MKIFRVAFILAVMMALPSVVVAHVLDGPGAAHYRSLKKVMASGKIGAFTKADSQTPSYLPLILKLKEGADPSQLDEYGVIIMHNRQDLYLTFVPFDRLDDVLEISILRSAHLGVPVQFRRGRHGETYQFLHFVARGSWVRFGRRERRRKRI